MGEDKQTTDLHTHHDKKRFGFLHVGFPENQPAFRREYEDILSHRRLDRFVPGLFILIVKIILCSSNPTFNNLPDLLLCSKEAISSMTSDVSNKTTPHLVHKTLPTVGFKDNVLKV